MLCVKSGDCVGIMRDSLGQVHFLYNGQDLGVVARGMDTKAWAIVDVYGKVNKVTLKGSAHKTNILLFNMTFKMWYYK